MHGTGQAHHGKGGACTATIQMHWQRLCTNQRDRLAAEPVDERHARLQWLRMSQQERLAVGSSFGSSHNALHSLVNNTSGTVMGKENSLIEWDYCIDVDNGPNSRSEWAMVHYYNDRS